MPQSWRFLVRPLIQSRSVSGLRYPLEDAGVAQLAEQLFCKQQVTGSIPVAGSSGEFFSHVWIQTGGLACGFRVFGVSGAEW